MKKVGGWGQRDVVFACLALLIVVAGLVLSEDFLYGGAMGSVALAVIWYMGRGPEVVRQHPPATASPYQIRSH